VMKDAEGFQLWETPKGQFWLPPKEDFSSIVWELADQECKIYEYNDLRVKSGDIVFDCGAHIGIYTREALNCGAKLVVAIEPSPLSIKCLHKNFKKEVEQRRVIIYEKGVWNREEILTFHTSEDSAGDSFVLSPKESKTISMPVTTIDKIVKELKLDHIDFIKMDIEGAEENAIIGAKETISNYKPCMAVAVYHSPDQSGQVRATVKGVYPPNQTQCGQCYIYQGRLNLQVMFFH